MNGPNDWDDTAAEEQENIDNGDDRKDS